MLFVKKYAKGFGSLATTVLVLLVAALTDNHVSTAEWLTIGASLVGTVAVVGIPNTPSSPAVKTVAQVLAPILGGFATAIVTPDGITPAVMCNVAIAALGAIGVYQIRNSGDTYTRLGETPSIP